MVPGHQCHKAGTETGSRNATESPMQPRNKECHVYLHATSHMEHPAHRPRGVSGNARTRIEEEPPRYGIPWREERAGARRQSSSRLVCHCRTTSMSPYHGNPSPWATCNHSECDATH